MKMYLLLLAGWVALSVGGFMISPALGIFALVGVPVWAAISFFA